LSDVNALDMLKSCQINIVQMSVHIVRFVGKQMCISPPSTFDWCNYCLLVMSLACLLMCICNYIFICV